MVKVSKHVHAHEEAGESAPEMRGVGDALVVLLANVTGVDGKSDVSKGDQ